VYSDEVTPGNQLKPNNLKKTQAVYWSIFEFGAAALADEEAWFEIAVMRSSVVKTIQGGMSAVFATVLEQFFNPNGHHMLETGITLHLFSGERKIIFIKFLYKLADEAALHAVWGCKGSSGLKPCLKCENVFNKHNARSVLEADTTGYAIDETCFDVERLVPARKDTIFSIIDERLAQAKPHMSNTAFGDIETNLGWSYLVGGVMLSRSLRYMLDPPKQTAFDWMHVFFVNGLFNIHVGCLMIALKRFNITYHTLHEYCSKWKWPNRVGETGIGALQPPRSTSSWKIHQFKCAASEGRSLLPVIAKFACSVLLLCSDARAQHGACFLLLVEVIELLEVSARVAVAPSRLKEAVVSYLNSFKGLYGIDVLVEKHHMALHLIEQIAMGFVPNCFVLERKHKHVKRFANEVDNTSAAFDASILREVTIRHITVLQSSSSVHFANACCLIKPKPSTSRNGLTLLRTLFKAARIDFDNEAIMVGRLARINEYEVCSVGDVVMIPCDDGVVAGKVQTHCAVEGLGTFSFIQAWQLVAMRGRFSEWSFDGRQLHLVETCSILWSCIWSSGPLANGVMTVLHPKVYMM